MEDRFVVVSELADRTAVDKVCYNLEQAGIPVMIEMLNIIDGSVAAYGYRVLTPFHRSQQALSLISGILISGIADNVLPFHH